MVEPAQSSHGGQVRQPCLLAKTANDHVVCHLFAQQGYDVGSSVAADMIEPVTKRYR